VVFEVTLKYNISSSTLKRAKQCLCVTGFSRLSHGLIDGRADKPKM